MRSLLWFSAAALAASAPAAAQATDTAKVTPVVVTATRTPINSNDAPATVSIITGDELRLRGATSLAAALETLPGVTIAQSGSFGGQTSLFMRGGESRYVKILIDGVPVNDPGGTIDLSTLTTDNVDHIEIVRGPASVLYGADAVTGVIQIFTRRGSGAPTAIVSARGGSYGSRDADGTLLGALPSGDYSLSVAQHDTKGIYPFNNHFDNTVGSGNVRLALDPQTELRLSFRYTDGLFHYPTDGGGDVVDTNAHATQERTTLAADITHYFNSRIDSHLTLTSEGTTDGTIDAPDDTASSGTQSLDHIRRRGAEARSNVQLTEATVLTGGVQIEEEDERSESNITFGSSFNSTSIFQASRRNKAAYVQLLSRLPDSVTLTAGARDDDNEQFGNFGTYRVGASWTVLPGTHLRASSGTAYAEPTFAENYSSGFETGNPRLQPEHTNTWEVGIRQSLFDDRVALGVTHFDQRFVNLIDFTDATTACGFSYCNVARASSKGREFEATLVATRQLSLTANLTHLETRVLTPGFDTTGTGLYHIGQQLIRRPTTTWNVGGQYTTRFASADLRLTHVGDRADRDFRPFPALEVVDPAYNRVDGGLDVPLASIWPQWPDAHLTAHVENLFDANYQSVFNFLSPRRTVLAGARLTF